MVVRGTNPLHSEKSMWNLVYPRNPRFLHIHSSASVDLTNHPCSSNPRYSRVNWINDLKSNRVSKSPQPLPWTKPRWEQVQQPTLPSSVLTLDGLLSTWWWSGRSHGTVSQREEQAPVAHPLHLSIRAIPARSPHSPPPLPPCSSSLGHPLPPEGFHSCFFYAGHSFPKHLQPSLPALPSVSAQRSPSLGAVAEHPVWTSNSVFLHSTYHHLTHHIEFPICLFSVSPAWNISFVRAAVFDHFVYYYFWHTINIWWINK